MTKSKIVEKNFSRDPDYYNQHAETQRYVANKLAKLIQKKHPGKIKKVLEIGCGTGFLTKRLLALFPDAEFTISDLSESMLNFCEQQTKELRLEKKIVAQFIINDISQSCPEGEFDLIISSLAFQWVDLAAVIQKLQTKLSSEGMLAFSTLSQGTFSTVKTIFDHMKIHFPSPKLLTNAKIKSTCKDFSNVELTGDLHVENFNSMLLFLRHIQGTGAGNASGAQLTSPELKKILKSSDEVIPAEYNITYTVAK